ncbi:hypothetical protein DFH07DRAFT_745275 [Mycena maculata]|uniref:Reverse transcriptase zinc-binding domain-containing protein n=1 Tax=Mycena maculata TaxID=230809 RepID=A0AAD7IW72_9AGAR|nr:hypothetical protein DFH07DRAFT_745275 [Mycena maculata]
MKLSLLLSFLDTNEDPSFNAAILGGLICVLQETSLETSITIHSSTTFLGNTFVTDRLNSENNPLIPNSQLIRSTIAALQERTGRIYFKKVNNNPAKPLKVLSPTPTLLDIQADLMSTNPGILLKEGNQRLFTKVIKSMRDKPTPKSTMSNLDRIRCSIAEVFEYQPTDSAIWTSLRSRNLTRLSRNFLRKCLHDIYCVGFFWEHMPNLENLGQCPTCKVPESLEHIMLECDAPGQHQICNLQKDFGD